MGELATRAWLSKYMHGQGVKELDKAKRVLEIFYSALPLHHDVTILSQDNLNNATAKANYKDLKDVFP